jgi:flap endonuclease-1
MFVFDGIPPSEKRIINNRAKTHLQHLWKAYEEAKEAGDEVKVRNLFQSKTLIFRKANVDAIELLKAMGVPAIIAPSEGEAQGAALVRSNLADALFTPDYDALLFGCHTIIRRVDFAEKLVELVSLETVLDSLELTLHQLIDLAILIGTDFNKGVPRIGPKRGLALIRKYSCVEDIPQISPPVHLLQIRELFQRPTVTLVEPSALPPNVEMVERLLIQKGFSHRRAHRARNRLLTAYRTHRTFQQPLVFEGGEYS